MRVRTSVQRIIVKLIRQRDEQSDKPSLELTDWSHQCLLKCGGGGGVDSIQVNAQPFKTFS